MQNGARGGPLCAPHRAGHWRGESQLSQTLAITGLGFPTEPSSSPDFRTLTESTGLGCESDMFLAQPLHSLEAVRPTTEEAKVSTEAEKEDGGFR